MTQHKLLDPLNNYNLTVIYHLGNNNVVADECLDSEGSEYGEFGSSFGRVETLSLRHLVF